MKGSLFKPGPAIIITAAFIGPGSLTVCAIAGVEFGYELLWAVVLSCIITIFFQDTVANLSFKQNKGLVELFNKKLNNSFLNTLFIGLVLISIVLGNAAYETGNISGAYIGLKNIIELFIYNIDNYISFSLYFFVGFLTFFFVLRENNRLIKNTLGIAVLLMSISFMFSAFLTKPSLLELLEGFFVPRWRPDTWSTIIAVLGTTIVPYNLFLHAALVKNEIDKLESSFLRRDIIISVCFGGLISSSIVIAAAGTNIDEISSINDMGKSLQILYGSNSQIFISFGLFAAGISSAITAPLAAGYVVEESFIKHPNSKLLKKAAIFIVIITGMIFSFSGYNPIKLIKLAQVANGLLLPGITLFICLICIPKKKDLIINKIRFIGLLLLFIFFTYLAVKFLF
tara:strand:- start:4096 stop:5289 length:1194 start_codon:yes stop_codon:yes gene_type:complete